VPNPDHFNYKDVVIYLSEKAKDYKNGSTKDYLLNGMKKYFDYLVEIGKRDDHPCKNLNLRNQKRKEIIHQDLFSSQELELLLEREERYADLKQKNQAMMSLLIYQGLNAGEMARLKIQHIDFDKGLIFIKSSKKIAQRHLEIQSKQYRILDKYINEGRKKLKSVETDVLLLGKLGKPITTEDVHYIVSTFKPMFPDRNLNPKTIRQSVISNWLNERKMPLEQVQLMSGQKWISTTAKYRQNSIEEQREMMNKWFPI
jgi:site-specific recombinase XerD